MYCVYLDRVSKLYTQYTMCIFVRVRTKNNYLTNTPKSENAVSNKIIVHKVHLMIGQIGYVCLSIYLFTGIPVTIYSTIELSDSVIVLGITPQNLRKNPGGAVD